MYINYIVNIFLVFIIIFIIVHLYVNAYGNERFIQNAAPISNKQTNKIVSKNCNRDPISMSHFCKKDKKKVRFFDEINNENYVDDYLMKSLINNSKTLDTKKVYTREDIDTYRNNFLSFNNKINQSSHDEDPVDKMNELIIEEDGNITNKYQNMPVRELYDYLTKQNQ